MAEVSRELDQLDARISGLSLDQRLGGAIAAAVVDEENLGFAVEPVEHRREPRQQLWDRVLLVVNGDDDRVTDAAHSPDRTEVGRQSPHVRDPRTARDRRAAAVARLDRAASAPRAGRRGAAGLPALRLRDAPAR